MFSQGGFSFDIPTAPIEVITQAGGGSARPFTSLYVPHFYSCTFVGYKVFYETSMS